MKIHMYTHMLKDQRQIYKTVKCLSLSGAIIENCIFFVVCLIFPIFHKRSVFTFIIAPLYSWKNWKENKLNQHY